MQLLYRSRFSASHQRARTRARPATKRTLLSGKFCNAICWCARSRLTIFFWIDSDAEPQAAEPVEKTEKEIQEEIQAIFRQITASVTFLPVLDGDCTFNVLVYADADSEVPVEWGDSDAKEIKNGEKVQLRSFSTTNHKVDTMVSYRLLD